MAKYNVGSIIEYSVFGGGIRRVRVTGIEEDIKNDMPGFDGIMCDPDGNDCRDEYGLLTVWGYDYQVTRVLRV